MDNPILNLKKYRTNIIGLVLIGFVIVVINIFTSGFYGEVFIWLLVTMIGFQYFRVSDNFVKQPNQRDLLTLIMVQRMFLLVGGVGILVGLFGTIGFELVLWVFIVGIILYYMNRYNTEAAYYIPEARRSITK